MRRKRSLLFTALLGALLQVAPLTAVALFDTAEIVLQAGQSFDSRQGTPNPFTDVTLTADVTSPSGRRYQVDGFFDGDGAGGAMGKVFKVRVFADEAGAWSWRTTSNRADLNGKSGSFTCSGSLTGVFAAGPLAVNPQRPHSFMYRRGRPVYLLGKFLDGAAPRPLQFSHTMLSEELTEANRQAMLDRHLGMSLNKVNLYLANKGDYDGVATTPWHGSAASNDKSRFDLGRWHMYERWVLRLRDAGLLAQLWFFADDSSFGDLPEADRKRLIRYGMARLSGYANTFFTLVLEWQEGWTSLEVQSHAEYLRQYNPWGRLASVHGVTGGFDFPLAPWADYMDIQAGNEVGPETVHALGLSQRLLAAKPLIQEEHGLGEEDDRNRRNAWAAFMAGAAGSGTGAFLRPLAQFTAALPFERLAPADSLVASGSAYALAEPGEVYVFYLPDGGALSANLAAAPGALSVEWFDPRQGVFLHSPDIDGGGVRSFTAPGPGDWALTLWRPALSLPIPAHLHTLPPCRLLDTRAGLGGEPGALRSGERRRLFLSGRCGLPATAQALAANLTVVAPTRAGHVMVWPGGLPGPNTSTINFTTGRTRANNVILPLAADGSVLMEPFLAGSPGAVHLVLDVSGYFD